ncbi:MAG TPA: UDP-3-O-acyl-N-acetylglucosamine deacetylase [Rhodospirillales bacterium]|nr:UDP-3-O-[3-hydroxymyristoyl] N-acetylglucosamine deacetylase [Rhodospirillaceae bacterium]HJN23567.1 UDP-3-O-acyl-N-acetylglucosamine deacetylase [Rhodospirillales bacterium]
MGGSIGNHKSAKRVNSINAVQQKTLKSSINCAGIALHSGNKVSMVLGPGEPDSGIVFKRTDIAGGGAYIPATWERVVDTNMCTTLGNDDGVTIGTVEHLMAALAGCRIDNATIEVNGPEIPIMDGSSWPFMFLLECAGIVEQDAPRRVIRIKKPVKVMDGGSVASLIPGNGFSLAFEIEFDSPVISRQSISIGLGNGAFKKELARARTFGLLHEVEQLQASGMALGGSLDNAVVISGGRVLNEDGLRYNDEFVRHKALDAVGDLYLAGAPIIGHFSGTYSGHAANHRLLQKLFADKDSCRHDLFPADEAEADDMEVAWAGDLVSSIGATA